MQVLSRILVLGALAAMPAVSFAQDSKPAPERAEVAELEWIADFDQAVLAARAANKDLLVDFTGSDWCIWCKRLHEEVFSKPSFQAYARENFIVVALDYPNDEAIRALVPNPERNAELVETYGIQGYPTVLLMTPAGEVFGRTGYQEGGPELYTEHLAKMLLEGKAQLAEAKKFVTEFAAANESNRVEIFNRALAAFSAYSSDSVGSDVLKSVIASALVFDADNAMGLKLAATKALLTAGKADAAVFTAARELDPKNADSLFELAVIGEINGATSIDDIATGMAHLLTLDELGIHDKGLAEELYFFGALYNWRYLEEPANARMFALKLEALEPENPNAQRLLDDLFGDIGREAGEDTKGEEVEEGEEAGN